MRVLLVEDEERVAREVAEALTRAGFLAERVSDGEKAWFAGGTEGYAAIVLDLGLPGLDGLSVLKRWRAEGVATPVLVLTARGSWMERVDGFDAGADDYLPKPFQIEELVARLRALIRRAAGQASPVIAVGPVTLDTRRMSVAVAGVSVAMTPLEYRLLAFLFHRRGHVVSHEELAEHVYGPNENVSSNTLEVLVGRVRRKVGPGIIATRRGLGYAVGEAAAA